DATRPTSDRVREALFSILFDVEGARVLDLFAGTGAFGLEALSRGAVHATFVEQARAALDALDRNVRELSIPQVAIEVRAQRVDRALAALARAGRRFELVFADPPYDDADTVLPAILPAITALLAPGGRVVLEARSTSEPPGPPPGLASTDARRYGETLLAFYAAPAEAPARGEP
ncbi:16S rRNA (guanine(966)-N(2))-methyltransferase RsmD, partial [Myxococcota bacterium]|nr:16S rRNA (guanine(966)-N(2))-methyltransferase RsmD [Myxococcota bacterium]